jgi:aromatic ring-opening dioxygenase LigB subunit
MLATLVQDHVAIIISAWSSGLQRERRTHRDSSSDESNNEHRSKSSILQVRCGVMSLRAVTEMLTGSNMGHELVSFYCWGRVVAFRFIKHSIIVSRVQNLLC